MARDEHSAGGHRNGARDLDRELHDHLALEAEAQEAGGLRRLEAERAARRLLGNAALVKEDVRAVSRWGWWERLVQDTRYAFRTFGRAPVFTITAVLSLALGIGANAAMFTLVNAALLRPLPVSRPDELVLVTAPDNFSFPTYRTFTAATRSFSHLIASSSTNRVGVDVGGGSQLASVKVASGGYFEGLGVNAMSGRVFTATEETDPLAVVSHAFWRTQLGSSPDVVGRLIRVGGTAFSVVGVAPAGFFGEAVGEAPDIWTTTAFMPPAMRNERGFTWLRIIGRLRPGVSAPQAEAELRTLVADVPFAVSPGARGTTGLRDRFTMPMTVMFAMVGIVLLITCTNLASLLLTRGTARGSEIAVRLALGASRWRIVRQLMTENMWMACLGGALGLLLSLWGARLLVALVAGAGQIVSLDLRPDIYVVLFVGGVCVLTCLLFGLAPALRTAMGRAPASLMEHGRRVAGRTRRWGLGEVLIAVQIALSLVLLAAGTMFVRTVRNLESQDMGSRVENLLVASIAAERGYRPDLAVLLPRLIERTKGLPGVESVSVASFGTLANAGGVYGLEVDGYTSTSDQDQRARTDSVAPDYFRTAGIPLVAGREFTWNDQSTAQRVAIVNETMARFYFGDGTAVGRHFRFNKEDYEIIGVARDAKYNDLREATTPRYVYFAQLQRGNAGLGSLEIRTAAGATPTLPVLRSLLRDVDPRLTVAEAMTMSERIDRKVGGERMVASLAAFFGALTLVLASIGIYGTLAYNTARRSREIGVRLALGSTRRSVIWLVIRHVVVQLSIGAALGLIGILAGARLVTSLLFGVQATDPTTIAVALVLLGSVALSAAAIPAIRAARLDAATVLRE